MLEKFGIDTSKVKDIKSLFTQVSKANAGQSGVSVNDFGITNADLKCVSKSDYIYNSELITQSYLEGLSSSEKVKLILELQEQNKSVRCENEQFRQKNFSMYLELRKFEKDKKNEMNDE